jgi:hypothetical protein
MGPLLKENIRAAAIAIALVVAGLFFWHLADLTDCREYAKKGSPASDLPKSACPKTGPYGSRSNVFLFALLAPLSSSATAGQQGNIPGKPKTQTPRPTPSLTVYLVPASATP